MSFFVPFVLCGQIELNQHSGKIPLVGNSQVKAKYIKADVPLSEIRTTNFSQPFDTSYTLPGEAEALWLKFSLLNTDSTSSDYFIFHWTPFITLYQVSDSDWTTESNGFFIPVGQRQFPKHPEMLALNLPVNVTSHIYLKITSSDLSDNFAPPFLSDNLTHYQQLRIEEQYNLPGAGFNLIYFSGLLVITFFVLILYLSVRKRVYGYYLAYLSLQLLYAYLVYSMNPFIILNSFFLIPPETSNIIFECVQFLFITFYILFIIELLEIPKSSRILAKVMWGLAWICLAYAIFNLSYNLISPSAEGNYFLFRTIRLIVLPINLVLIIWIVLKVKHPLIKYFILGNIFFYTGSVLSVYVAMTGLNQGSDSIFHFRNSLNTIFQMGLFGEVVCFSFAVAHHVKLIYKLKERNSKAYIEQLKENQLIQLEMNKELDRKIDQKTTELIQVYSDIEKQREKEIKNSYSQKIKETEMLALRSQMNPHFLFNSMNAIKHLILTNRPDDAMLYLDNFASLLRGVLQNSKRKTITVEDELEQLELYISLEKTRLGSSLECEIVANNKDELSQYQIPALLLQPFVENAIWHGLQPKAGNQKKLTVTFDTRKELIITIRDNGIGREAARKFREDNSTRKSFGIQITHERLALFNHLNDLKINLEITDLMENGSSTGTLATFTYSI